MGNPVEVLACITRLGCHVVSVDIVVAPVRDPHRGAVAPDTSGATVPGSGKRVEVLACITCLGHHIVGVDFSVVIVIVIVRDPHRGAVAPDTSGVIVPGSSERLEVLGLCADQSSRQQHRRQS